MKNKLSLQHSASILTILTIYSVVMLWTLFSLSSSSHEIATRTTPQISASKDIKYELAKFHLWFEELIHGDESVSKQAVWNHIDNALWYVNALLNGDNSSVHKYLAIENTEIQKQLYDIEQLILDMSALALKRLENTNDKKIGYEIDDQFDDLFRSAINHASLIEEVFFKTVDSEIKLQDTFTQLAYLLSILSSIAFGIYIFRYESKQIDNQQSLNQFKSTLDETLDCIFMFHADNLKYFYVNAGAKQQVGYNQKELMSKKPYDLTTEFDEQSYKILLAPMLSGRTKTLSYETSHQHKNGNLIPVEVFLQHIAPSGERARFVAIVRDITDRKKYENVILQAKKEAQNANEAKSTFLSSMSHEIRTPMNGVLGMLNLLQNSNLDDSQRQRITIAKNSAESLLCLINDILDFSKVEAGKLDLETLEFDVLDMLSEFADSMGHLAQNKDIELILDTTAIKQTGVKGDPGRLRQILTNVVGNAIKFTSEGSVLIRTELFNHNVQQYRFICSVEDTGIGIPANKLDSLFTSFNQADASTTRKFGGTGLGLTISKKLSELMQGNITIESTENKGSTFTVEVLLDKGKQFETPASIQDLKNQRTLVIDPCSKNIDVMEKQLTNWGIKVSTAKNETESQLIIENIASPDRKPFDTIIVNHKLKNMTGIEFVKLLTSTNNYNDVTFILMTNIDTHIDKHELAINHIHRYFSKPTTSKKLLLCFEKFSVDLVTSTTDDDDVIKIEEQHRKWKKDTKVLLVEDNYVNQLVATTTLESLDLSVDVAKDGVEAIEKLKNKPESSPYALVIMDCQMPNMDGFEASRQIRSCSAGIQNNTIPIIALTANAMIEDKEKCLAAGMDDYMSKPFEHADLEAKLIKWLVRN